MNSRQPLGTDGRVSYEADLDLIEEALDERIEKKDGRLDEDIMYVSDLFGLVRDRRRYGFRRFEGGLSIASSSCSLMQWNSISVGGHMIHFIPCCLETITSDIRHLLGWSA